MEDKLLREGERIDDLQRGGRRIIQHPGRFCFGMDAVLLASFARALPGEKVLDLCTGTGIIPLLMEKRYPRAYYTGLEIQKESADMAARSVLLNDCQETVRILRGDLRETGDWSAAGSWDAITVNPPYMKAPSGLPNEKAPLNIARHETECTLEDVIRVSAGLLKSRGRFYMVHRPLRLAEIIELMRRYRLEPKRLQFVHPKIDREPNMILIEGVRGGGEELRVQPPLVIYRADGTYTEPVRRIYEE